MLFAAARADHVVKTIRPALLAGRWVLSDRFLDSSLAYQSAAAGLSREDLLALHRVGSSGLLPDRTLLLALPFEEATRRAHARDRGAADRIGARNPAYHQGVAALFLKLADSEPGRFRVIDALGPPAEVTARLLAAIADL